ALPREHRAMFAAMDCEAEDLPGLYLSAYIDWRRLLGLTADGEYRLLFWKNDHRTDAPGEVRFYSGQYEVLRTGDGDHFIRLDLTMTKESLGSDENDSELFIVRTGGEAWLLQAVSIEDIATAIGGRGTMGRSDQYFRRTRLADQIPPYEPQMEALPFSDLPVA